jgi:C4-dicarboxylate transporter
MAELLAAIATMVIMTVGYLLIGPWPTIGLIFLGVGIYMVIHRYRKGYWP